MSQRDLSDSERMKKANDLYEQAQRALVENERRLDALDKEQDDAKSSGEPGDECMEAEGEVEKRSPEVMARLKAGEEAALAQSHETRRRREMITEKQKSLAESSDKGAAANDQSEKQDGPSKIGLPRAASLHDGKVVNTYQAFVEDHISDGEREQ